MKYTELYELVFGEVYEGLDKAERFLKSKISKEQNTIIKAELTLMLLVILLKKNKIETFEMKNLLKDLYKLIKKSLKILKKKGDKMLLDVFYKTNIYRLFYLNNLYNSLGITIKGAHLVVLRKSLEKNQAQFEKNYRKAAFLRLEKGFSNYGTSFWYLFVFAFIAITFFGTIYFFSDKYKDYPYVCGESCMIKSQSISEETLKIETHEEKQIKPYYYYLYISLGTMSNLGADIGSAADDEFLAFMLALEQIVGVVIFGLLINLISRGL